VEGSSVSPSFYGSPSNLFTITALSQFGGDGVSFVNEVFGFIFYFAAQPQIFFCERQERQPQRLPFSALATNQTKSD
jgi:hypothetical protein